MQHTAQPPERLDEIATQWSLLRLSTEQSFSSAESARRALVLRYAGAIRSYVGALVRDDHDADEVAQEAVVRLMKGDFGGATPTRGRFRDLLKVSVRNMVYSHWDRKRRRAAAMVDVEQLPDRPTDETDSEEPWLQSWRSAVLAATWQSLEAYKNATPGSVAYTVLRLRTDHPDDRSEQLAHRLSESTGREYQAAALRQQLRRARLRFAQFLLEELHRSLADPTPESVEEELIELGLLPYVADFLPDDWRETGALRSD